MLLCPRRRHRGALAGGGVSGASWQCAPQRALRLAAGNRRAPQRAGQAGLLAACIVVGVRAVGACRGRVAHVRGARRSWTRFRRDRVLCRGAAAAPGKGPAEAQGVRPLGAGLQAEGRGGGARRGALLPLLHQLCCRLDEFGKVCDRQSSTSVSTGTIGGRAARVRHAGCRPHCKGARKGRRIQNFISGRQLLLGKAIERAAPCDNRALR